MELCHYFELMTTSLFVSIGHCIASLQYVRQITLYWRNEIFLAKCLNNFTLVRTRTFINMA